MCLFFGIINTFTRNLQIVSVLYGDFYMSNLSVMCFFFLGGLGGGGGGVSESLHF